MLLDEGEVRFIGNPEEAGRQYLRMNFEKRKVTLDGNREVVIVPDFLARVSEAWLEDEEGERITNVEAEQQIRLNAVIEARQELSNPGFGLQVNNADGVEVFEFERRLGDENRPASLAPGQQIRISATVDNPLMPGRYAIVCWVAVIRNDEETAQQAMKLLDFVVFGISRGQAIVSVPGELDLMVDEASTPERKT
jgi:hypothetical protein